MEWVRRHKKNKKGNITLVLDANRGFSCDITKTTEKFCEIELDGIVNNELLEDVLILVAEQIGHSRCIRILKGCLPNVK